MNASSKTLFVCSVLISTLTLSACQHNPAKKDVTESVTVYKQDAKSGEYTAYGVVRPEPWYKNMSLDEFLEFMAIGLLSF